MSAEHAARIINELRNGRKVLASPKQAAMYRAIMAEQEKQGDFTLSKLSYILERAAPSFFLDEPALRDIVLKFYKKKR